MGDGHVKTAMSFLMLPWIGSCAETEVRMSDQLDGDLPAREERRVRRHLARCRRCASVYDSLVRAVERVRALGREDIDAPMPSVAVAVAERIRHERQ